MEFESLIEWGLEIPRDYPIAWEERNGELWYDTGIDGEVFGEKADTWVKAIDEDGYFIFATTRFVKA